MNAIEAIEHIVKDDYGVAWIKDSKVKVIEVVLDQQAYGWSPEEVHFQHPCLSMAQIHAALAYYFDHQAELEAEIKKRLDEVERLEQLTTPSPLVAKLRKQKGKGN